MLIILGLGGCGDGGSPSQATEDAMLVRCLSDETRPDLVAAAVTLGLAERGPRADQVQIAGDDVTIDQWPEEYSESFERACSAAVAAAGLETGDGTAIDEDGSEVPSALLTAVLSLLVAVLTAFVGTAATARLNDAGRRRHLADKLRQAATDLRRAGQRYTRGVRGDDERLSHDEVLARMKDVDDVVEQIRVEHPSWLALGPPRKGGWPSPDTDLDAWVVDSSDDRATLADKLAAGFAHRVGTAYWQAEQMRQPLWHWWSLHRERLPGPEVTVPLGKA